MTETIDPDALLSLTAEIVSAHVTNNRVGVVEVPLLIRDVHAALSGLVSPEPEEQVEPQKPAVSIRSSIKPDHLICLEDGKQLTMLKRYLMRNFGMTPADYRAKWKLPPDYPMVAPNYAEKRRVLANTIGLGRKRSPVAVEVVEPPRRTRRRKSKDAAVEA